MLGQIQELILTTLNQCQSQKAKPGPPWNREQPKGKHLWCQGEAGEGCTSKGDKSNNQKAKVLKLMQDQVRPPPSPHCPCRTCLRSNLYFLYFYGRGSLCGAEGSRFFQADTKTLRPSPLTLSEVIHQVIKAWPAHRDTAPSKAGTHEAAVCNSLSIRPALLLEPHTHSHVETNLPMHKNVLRSTSNELASSEFSLRRFKKSTTPQGTDIAPLVAPMLVWNRISEHDHLLLDGSPPEATECPSSYKPVKWTQTERIQNPPRGSGR